MSEELAVPSSNEPDIPRTRIRSQQRDALVYGLNLALDDGQLDYEETQKRATIANRATYMDEVMPLLSDLNFGRNLPATTNPQILDVLTQAQQQGLTEIAAIDAATTAMTQPQNQALTNYSNASKNTASIAIFSGSSKRGPWLVGPKHNVFGAFGGVHIDLRQAQLAGPVTTIRTAMCFGGVNIKVPENYRIIESVFPLFGGASVTDGKGVTLKLSDLPPDAPVIDLRGIMAFGGLEIKRVPINK